MATLYLPQNLTALFPGSARQVEVAGETVLDLLHGLNERWPGMRNRLVEAGPALREHILIFVDGEKADLNTPVQPNAEVRVIPAITGG